jgi:hypothetical protein
MLKIVASQLIFVYKIFYLKIKNKNIFFFSNNPYIFACVVDSVEKKVKSHLKAPARDFHQYYHCPFRVAYKAIN